MQQLIQDLKNETYKQMYLLYGEEDYLRKQYRDKLKAALVADGDTMNYHYYEGKDINVGEIIDLAETLPFFADRRVIILENSGLCKSGGDALAEYLKQPAADVPEFASAFDESSGWLFVDPHALSNTMKHSVSSKESNFFMMIPPK